MRFFRRGMDGRPGRFRPCLLVRDVSASPEKIPAGFCAQRKKRGDKKTPAFLNAGVVVVPRTGLEPAHLAAHVPETCVSTNSTIEACGCKYTRFSGQNKFFSPPDEKNFVFCFFFRRKIFFEWVKGGRAPFLGVTYKGEVSFKSRISALYECLHARRDQ